MPAAVGLHHGNLDRDLRVTVSSATSQRYGLQIQRLHHWLAAHQFPPLHHLVVDTPALVLVLQAYVQDLCNSQRPLSYASETLAAIQLFYPVTRGLLKAAWTG